MEEAAMHCADCGMYLRGVTGYSVRVQSQSTHQIVEKTLCAICLTSKIKTGEVKYQQVKISQVGCSVCGKPMRIDPKERLLAALRREAITCDDECAEADKVMRPDNFMEVPC